jgi:hypothetical protein
MPEDPNKILISFEEVERVVLEPQWPQTPPPPPPPPGATGGSRQWGAVAVGPGAVYPGTGAATQGGSFFLQGWVYLGLAGLVGAFLAWAICEPYFDDGNNNKWGNNLIFPMMLSFVCTGLGLAESLVERSTQKAITKGVLALFLGIIFGFVFNILADKILSMVLLSLEKSHYSLNENSPALWVGRAIAWMAFGVSGGLVYGIVGQSKKKCLYGVLGGVVGAGIGGLLFDPIGIIIGGAEVSRMIGISIFGVSTGIAIGFVESALKDRWFYVSAGPLAGKQFILYKPVTSLGSLQANDIYLFKDPSIQPLHATIEIRGAQTILLATGPTYIGGQPVTQQLLRSGDVVQIGKYAFTYQEKHQRR